MAGVRVRIRVRVSARAAGRYRHRGGRMRCTECPPVSVYFYTACMFLVFPQLYTTIFGRI